tara:strand:- start:301 stop:729 length:429 start_codon:yes stop_codon:yes gene_type:complete
MSVTHARALCTLLAIDEAGIAEIGPESDGLRRFKLVETATFTCSVRGVSITSKTVVLDVAANVLLSNGRYGQRLIKIRYEKEAERSKCKRPTPPNPPPGGPDKHIYRPASKSGAMKCAACGCYSRHLTDTGSCKCGKKRYKY